MVFGAYPTKWPRASLSPERPLLDGASSPVEGLEDAEYEPKSPLPSRYRRKSRSSHLRPRLLSFAIGAGLFILGLQSLFLWKLWRKSNSPDVLGEINRLVPSAGKEVKIFEPDPNFDPLNANDPEWLRVMPKGGGFVPINNWRGKLLKEPIHTHGQDIYNVAVFHQMHCLHMLAEEFGNMLDGKPAGEAVRKRAEHSKHHGGVQELEEDHMMWHIRHCFEYLKSSLTCCADATLEGQQSNTNDPATDGFGAHHTCRKFGDVFNWAEANRVTDQEGYPH